MIRGRSNPYEIRLQSMGMIDDSGIAAAIASRVNSNCRPSRGGYFVLADTDKHVYLLPETSNSAIAWINRFPAMLVGLYSSAKEKITAQAIKDDLAAQRATLHAQSVDG